MLCGAARGHHDLLLTQSCTVEDHGSCRVFGGGRMVDRSFDQEGNCGEIAWRIRCCGEWPHDTLLVSRPVCRGPTKSPRSDADEETKRLGTLSQLLRVILVSASVSFFIELPCPRTKVDMQEVFLCALLSKHKGSKIMLALRTDTCAAHRPSQHIHETKSPFAQG
jgi:hypothetical protein